ncbi:NADH-cytochrome b5 reductase [Tieghemiomyces parasiticus]|uniref:NADH-cytochrome b5 reductase n=1 Tax=Tieghemiomyces parasiticus TaxID=78921 RepID=A0A9W8E0P7_9FUNG|nr:NADH-cytochrome b5 reductase [Tieghemiomyces parasiticus]
MYLAGTFLVAAAAYVILSRWRVAPTLDPVIFHHFPLVRKTVVTYDTAMYRFGLSDPDSVLGVPVGHHVKVMAYFDGKPISRSYTPVSAVSDRGHFDLLVKSYPSGHVSKMFGELTLGDKINVCGPKGRYEHRPDLHTHLGMIAGGTGLAPMLAVIRCVLGNRADKTRLHLIFANSRAEDILLRRELDELSATRPNFTVHYVLSHPPAQWDGGVGHVDEWTIRKHLPAPGRGVKILLSGSKPMMATMTQYCEAIGHGRPQRPPRLEDRVFVF